MKMISLMSILWGITMFSASGAQASEIDFSFWAGDYSGHTLTEWMKADSRPEWNRGVNAPASIQYNQSVQIPESTEFVQQLVLNYESGYASTPRTSFSIYKNKEGQIFERAYSYDQTRVLLVPFEARGNRINATYEEDYSGSHLKYETIIDFEDEHKVVLTLKHKCCDISMGHMGCFLYKMCADVMTFNR